LFISIQKTSAETSQKEHVSFFTQKHGILPPAALEMNIISSASLDAAKTALTTRNTHIIKSVKSRPENLTGSAHQVRTGQLPYCPVGHCLPGPD